MMTADGSASDTKHSDRPDYRRSHSGGDGGNVDLKAKGEDEHHEVSRLDTLKAKMKGGLAWYVYGLPQNYRG